MFFIVVRVLSLAPLQFFLLVYCLFGCTRAKLYFFIVFGLFAQPRINLILFWILFFTSKPDQITFMVTHYFIFHRGWALFLGVRAFLFIDVGVGLVPNLHTVLQIFVGLHLSITFPLLVVEEPALTVEAVDIFDQADHMVATRTCRFWLL